jgi:hypothetical protein
MALDVVVQFSSGEVGVQFSSGEVGLRLFFEMALNVPKEGAKANGVGYGWTE